MKKFLKGFLLLSFLLALVLTPLKTHASEHTFSKDINFNKSIYDLKISERRLWIDHVSWTRN